MANDKEKLKSGLEDMTEQEFLEMCRREAPQFDQMYNWALQFVR